MVPSSRRARPGRVVPASCPRTPERPLIPNVSVNGIDAATGRYLLQVPTAELVRAATGEPPDPATVAELQLRLAGDATHFGLKSGLNPGDLAEAGWGLVLPAEGLPDEEAVLEALAPLLELRRAQASRLAPRYRVYRGEDGYREGESKQQFLARHGVGPGPADPDRVPYYLLLLGDPGAIPFRVQSQIGVQYAVGRLHFESIEAYAAYARAAVAAETRTRPHRAVLFGVANPDDPATQTSAADLVGPLAKALSGRAQIDCLVGPAATRAALEATLAAPPALLFTASHGMGFPRNDRRQLAHQGALLCQDWPGPVAWGARPIPEEHYLAGDHLSPDLDLTGTISFLFACFGAGTPELDAFARQAYKTRAQIAPWPFLAALPQAMLSRPRGGALAVVGHVERAWGVSFAWPGPDGKPVPQTAVFEDALYDLLGGLPVGAAMASFSRRAAELAADLAYVLEEREFGAAVDEEALALTFAASMDASGYAIVGDPAVRLRTEPPGTPARPAV